MNRKFLFSRKKMCIFLTLSGFALSPLYADGTIIGLDRQYVLEAPEGIYSQSYTDVRSGGAKGGKGRLEDLQQNLVRRYTNQILRFSKLWGKHTVNGLLACT